MLHANYNLSEKKVIMVRPEPPDHVLNYYLAQNIFKK
jgi:hypothetical protein